MYRVKNTTQFPTREIRKLIQAAKGHFKFRNVQFNIKNSSWIYQGRAYRWGCVASPHNGPLVILRIHPTMMNENQYPLRVAKRRNFEIVVENWHELFLFVLAHEIFHTCANRRDNENHRSEVEADRHAFYQIEEYRRRK